MDGNGNVKFLIDGVKPVVDVTGFTFDDGDVVHAFYSQLNDTNGDPVVRLIEWESGHLSARGLVDINDISEAGQDVL